MMGAWFADGPPDWRRALIRNQFEVFVKTCAGSTPAPSAVMTQAVHCVISGG